MKKLVVLTSVLFLVLASMSFGAWKSWEDFNTYKDVRKAAMEAEGTGDTLSAVSNYKKAADLAGKSATKDIQAWQINNAAFVLIKQFKTLVGYDDKLAKLSDMKPSKDKIAFQKELADGFSMKADLLTEAKALLEEGKALQAGDEPTAKIQSNIDFIAWVDDFVKNGGNVAPLAEAKADVQADAKTDVKADPKAEAKADVKTDVKTDPKPDTKAAATATTK
jgi:hypothetical protein